MIQVEGLAFSRQGKRIIEPLSFTISDGSVWGVVGPNGSGKTTLLRLLYGALCPEAGVVRINGRPLGSLARRVIARQVAVVTQNENPESALSIADSVMLGRIPHRRALQAPSVRDYQACADALERVGVAELADRPASQVSGGEAQRALIARAVAQEAEHILLDEPTNHLDIRHQHEVLTTVRELGATVVIVLHDLNLAATYCDTVLLLDGGRSVACGTPTEVLTAAHLEPVYRVSVDVLIRANGRPHLVLGERPLPHLPNSERKTA